MLVEDEEEEFIRSGAGFSRRQPRAFLQMGGGAAEQQAEQMLMAEYVKYKNKGGDMTFEQFVQAVMQQEQQRNEEIIGDGADVVGPVIPDGLGEEYTSDERMAEVVRILEILEVYTILLKKPRP